MTQVSSDGADLTPVPKEEQMQLFAPFYQKDSNRAFKTADIYTRYHLTKTRNIYGKNVPLELDYFHQDARSTITAANLAGGRTTIFPGGSEQLIELVLRQMTVEQIAPLQLWNEGGLRTHHVCVHFSLAELRRRLDENKTGRPLNEIRQSLQVLSRCNWEVTTQRRLTFVDSLSGPILRIERHSRLDGGDEMGQRELYQGWWHPLIAEEILQGDYYLLNPAIVRLKDPLARWMVNRFTCRWRQAHVSNAAEKKGYTISLRMILNESGINQESRLWNTVDRVRAALKEIVVIGDDRKELPFLALGGPFDEILTFEPTRGRSKITDARWILYPSATQAELVKKCNWLNQEVRQPSRHISPARAEF